MIHYEVIAYTDETHSDGQIVAITPDAEHAAEIADHLRQAGHTQIDIRRFE